MRDVDVQHNGVEIEFSYTPTSKLRLKGMGSIGDWKYTRTIDADVNSEDQDFIENRPFYVSGVKVGDAAQFVAYLEAD